MKANSLFAVLIIAALLAVTTLTVREALATAAIVSNVDSATRSYTDWAKSVERSDQTVDSATRSYTEWAKSVESRSVLVPVTGNIACNNFTVPANLDSATRSYVTWAYTVGCR